VPNSTKQNETPRGKQRGIFLHAKQATGNLTFASD